MTHHPAVFVPLATLCAGAWLVGSATVGAHAADQGVLNTASLQWDSADSDTAIWSGGQPVDFDPRQTGWRVGPFDFLGELGMAGTLTVDPSRRNQYLTRNEVITIEQGVSHTMELSNQIAISTIKRVTAEVDITARGNSLRYDIGLSDYWAGSLPGQRLYWNVDFAAGANTVYESPQPHVLIARDTSDTAALAVLHIQATHGEPVWAGRAINTDPLPDGNPQATGYVRNITESSTDVTIHVFVIDYDPCGVDSALTLARSIAADPPAWFGEVIPVQSDCVTSDSWTYLTDQDGPQDVVIGVDQTVTDPAESTRRYTLQGVPAFLEATITADTNPATVALTARDQEVRGRYPLELASWRETTDGQTTVRSAPLRQTIHLDVTNPPPPAPQLPSPPATLPEPVASDSPPTSASSSSGQNRRESNDDPANPVPPPPALPNPPAPSPPQLQDLQATPNQPEPNFQFQESTPPTPLPTTPDLPDATGVMVTPGMSLWASLWWLWVSLGVSLSGWLLFAWRRRRRSQGVTQYETGF